MRYLGIDYGTKRVGISLSDESGGFAFAHTILENNEKLISEIKKIAQKNEVGEIVVGEPKTISGGDNPFVKDVDRFVEKLKSEISFDIHKEPEAFSSVEASRFAPKDKQHDDSAAAAIILQRYLDMHRVQKNSTDE